MADLLELISLMATVLALSLLCFLAGVMVFGAWVLKNVSILNPFTPTDWFSLIQNSEWKSPL